MTSSSASNAEVVNAGKQIITSTATISQDNTRTAKILAKLTGSDFVYFIQKDQVVIGRNSSHGKVDVNIEASSYISRRHLQINYEKGRFLLVCLGKNGVFVNGQFQRVGASPLPLDKACLIRFPSTSIRLEFDPNPLELNQVNGDTNQLSKGETKTPESVVNQTKNVSSHLTIPMALLHSKSASPINTPSTAIKDNKQEFSLPSLKCLIPRDPRGFLSAPPSPTGTISAVNSCPASPRGGTPHFSNQNHNVTENLSAAASAIAASVLDKGDDKFLSGEGVESKPPYSYAQLIIQAISSAMNRQLTLSGIYAHITKHYPYYRTADKGWQNSIRHNLSLNRYFVKVPRSQEESGKGSFWRVDPSSERKLVEQAWRKRRQRAVPCFCSSLTAGISTITRSAPVSPEHSHPMSPVTAPHGGITVSQEDYQSSGATSDTNGKVQLVQFTTRYAQSAPGSPANLRHGVVMVGEGNPTPSNTSTQQQATILATPTTLSSSEIATNKMMWSLQTISNQTAAATNTFSKPPVQTTWTKQVRTNTTSADTQTALINSSKMSSTIQTASSAPVNLTTLATLTSSQHRQLMQQAQIPQQVVMMPGQPPQRFPINMGTLVAASNNLMPFVLPVNQQYIVKRVGDEASDEPHTKKLKTDDGASGELRNVKASD